PDLPDAATMGQRAGGMVYTSTINGMEGAGPALSPLQQCESRTQQRCERFLGDQMKHLSLALVFTIMLLSESAKAATDDGNLCALRLPATKAVGKPRA